MLRELIITGGKYHENIEANHSTAERRIVYMVKTPEFISFLLKDNFQERRKGKIMILIKV